MAPGTGDLGRRDGSAVTELFHVAFEVPGNPRGKGRPRAAVMGGHVRVYTDAKTRSEEAVVRDMARQAMGDRPPYEGAVVLIVTAYRQIPASFSKLKHAMAESGELLPTTKPDADNIIKLCGDSLNGILFRDDCQVVTAVIHKRYSSRPRMMIDVQGQCPRPPFLHSGEQRDPTRSAGRRPYPSRL